MKCPECGYESERCVKFSPRMSKSGRTLFLICPNCGKHGRYFLQRWY